MESLRKLLYALRQTDDFQELPEGGTVEGLVPEPNVLGDGSGEGLRVPDDVHAAAQGAQTQLPDVLPSEKNLATRRVMSAEEEIAQRAPHRRGRDEVDSLTGLDVKTQVFDLGALSRHVVDRQNPMARREEFSPKALAREGQEHSEFVRCCGQVVGGLQLPAELVQRRDHGRHDELSRHQLPDRQLP